MTYRRIYKIAMERIKEIADDLLCPIAVRDEDVYIKFWYTLDGKGDTDDPALNCYCENETFAKLQKIAKDEFGVSIVRVDNSKTSQMLLDELKVELEWLKNNHIKE